MTLEDIRQRIIELARGASIEISLKDLPKTLEGAKPRLLYIPSFPNKDPLASTIAFAVSLKEKGFNPVPHIAARNYQTQRHLENALDALQKSGISRILLIAGDRKKHGAYSDTLAVISGGIFNQYGITHIDFAGHPSGNPNAKDQSHTDAAMKAKNDFAQNSNTVQASLVTQMSFDIRKVSRWVHRIKIGQGNTLPITVGLCGVLQKPSQIFHAARLCGFDLTKIIVNAPGIIPALLNGGSSTRQIIDCARSEAIAGMHFFTFGKTALTIHMLNALQQGHFQLDRDILGRVNLRVPKAVNLSV